MDQRRKEDERRRNRLGRCRIVLADPDLTEAEPVGQDDLFGGFLVDFPLASWKRMDRLQEHSKFYHDRVLNLLSTFILVYKCISRTRTIARRLGRGGPARHSRHANRPAVRIHGAP